MCRLPDSFWIGLVGFGCFGRLGPGILTVRLIGDCNTRIPAIRDCSRLRLVQAELLNKLIAGLGVAYQINIKYTIFKLDGIAFFHMVFVQG